MTFRAICLLIFLASLRAGAQRVEVDRAPGEARFVIESDSVVDLSGITWMGGDSFAAVSDKRKIVQLLTLTIDGTTGAITAGRFGDIGDVPVSVGDFEGIAWVSASKTFYISAEEDHSVLRFAPGSPAARLLSLPPIFEKARRNLSVEALTWNDTAQHFWIANEEALTSDGELSSRSAGTLVRLQKLDAKFRPLAQFAWRTEPAALRYGGAGSGVADLCLLPDGRLLVLERSFAEGGLRLRLFLADFKGATNTARLPALAGADFTEVRKTLLFEEVTSFTNFEGLTLGPALADGWRSLIVVADSNGTATHTFLALKVRPAASREVAPRKR